MILAAEQQQLLVTSPMVLHPYQGILTTAKKASRAELRMGGGRGRPSFSDCGVTEGPGGTQGMGDTVETCCCCPVTKSCLFATPWTVARQASLSFAISRSLLRFMSIELMMLSNHLIFCHPLFLPPSIFPSTRIYSKELALLIRWPKYWSFRISPSNE